MPPRILIIEDDAGTRHALRNLLQDESFVVKLAIDGRDGLDQHLSFKPDLILLDLHMPFMAVASSSSSCAPRSGIRPRS